jgi:phosphatidylinositol alpha-1,6-mannosyltransferase
MQMVILIVSVDFPPHTDGVSTVSHELATRLAGYGEEVIVIGPKAEGDREYDRKQKFKVIRTPWYEYGYLRFLPILFVMPYAIFRYRVKLVLPMNIAYGGTIAYFLSGIMDFKYAMWAYGYEFGKFEKNSLMKRLYLKIYEKALFVAAITDFVKTHLIQFGVASEKVILVKPGTDPAKYYPLSGDTTFKRKYGLTEGRKIILSVGRLVERKGVDMTIRALKRVKQAMSNVLYLVVGDGPYRQRLEEIASEEGVEGMVKFVGRISDEELVKFYNVCDLFIMASRTIVEKGDVEGYGIVFLEANACGKPVIGGRDGGMSEAIEDGVTGLLVDSHHPDKIAEGIIRILSDERYARELGENGRRRVVESHNWGNAIGKFYRELKKGSGFVIN